MADPVCVQWAERKDDGGIDHTMWCATQRKTTRYSDAVKTSCGFVVSLPWGLERREPTCPECLDEIERQRHA